MLGFVVLPLPFRIEQALPTVLEPLLRGLAAGFLFLSPLQWPRAFLLQRLDPDRDQLGPPLRPTEPGFAGLDQLP